MKNIRVIPRLDIKGPNLVKGIHLEGLRVLGKPEQYAKYYYETGADELIYMDIVASLYGRNSLLDIVERTATEIFIPLIVGGGLRTIDDINKVLRAGADKVALNTAAIRNPSFIKEAANRFGASTIIVSIEAIKQSDGQYYAFTDNGREPTGKEVITWAEEAVSHGAGEILLTCVDQEGTGFGYDIELVRKVSEAVSIPVIACGGAGKLEDLENVVKNGLADAVCLSSMLHYDYIQRYKVEGDFSSEGNIEFLKSRELFKKIKSEDMHTIKSFLLKAGISCRHELDEELVRAAS
jgi:cyclase